VAQLRSPGTFEDDVLASPAVQRQVQELADDVAEEARALTRLRAYDEGELLGAIEVLPNGYGRIVRMGVPPRGKPKPIWIEHGTGVYGPRRKPIVPKKAGGRLVFKVNGPGGETTVFAKSVKGRPASHIMRDAGAAVATRRGLPWRPSNL
jgi:hypothetical protein